MTATSRSVQYLATCLLLTGNYAAYADDSGTKGAPPFPLSKQTQQLAYDYLVCATRAFDKNYAGTIELD